MPSLAFCAMYASTRLACASISAVGKVSARAKIPIAKDSPGRQQGGAYISAPILDWCLFFSFASASFSLRAAIS
eukprot:169155-Pleurochrysis_carterae.AAC.5